MRVHADERGRLEEVLSLADGAASLADFLSVTLAALDERLGFRESAFMLAVSGQPRAYAGAKYGSPDYVLEEYFERWVDTDALGSPAAQMAFATRGWATIRGVYRDLDAPRRRFVDDFLRRTRATEELSVRLSAAGSVGYLTVMRSEEFDAHDRTLLAALVPELARLLRERLPRGLDHDLSARETQVAELVALGFSNREIGAVLHVEEDTVKKHVSHILAGLRMTRRAELAAAWASGHRFDVAERIGHDV